MRPTLITVGLLFTLGAAGCSSGGGQPSPQVSSVLSSFDTGTDYAATKRCLSSFDYDSVEVLDDQHLLFTKRPGNDYWLNTLRARCPGLGPRDTLLLKRTSDQLCNLDTAQAIEHFMFWRRSGPVCTLGKFNQLTENQAALIKEATKKKSS